MQLSIGLCSPWQRRPCSCAGLTRARFSRQLRSPVRLIVCLDSGRLDALYPYCVEAGGATHLDALMVMLMLWQPSCWLISVVIGGAKSGRVSNTGSGFGAMVAAEQDSRLPLAHARGAAGPLEERTRQHIGQVCSANSVGPAAATIIPIILYCAGMHGLMRTS
jgi:hypothetical protein